MAVVTKLRYSTEPKRPFHEQTKKMPNGCIEFTGLRNPQGYGVIRKFLGEPDEKRAHRRSWVMSFGEIPKGLLVLHKCDNPPCVNPEHLFLGTSKDNSDDKHRKGRGRYLKGSQTGNARLREEDVVRIRESALFGADYSDLLRVYGISRQLVSAIVTRKVWKHVA